MVLLGVLLVAVLVHEGTHWLTLRQSGAKIRPAILRPKLILLISLGLGCDSGHEKLQVGGQVDPGGRTPEIPVDGQQIS